MSLAPSPLRLDLRDPPTDHERPRRRWRVPAFVGLALAGAAVRAGLNGRVVNGGGWAGFVEFWTAAARPELSAAFLRITWEATLDTIGFAVLGTALSVAIGVAGAAFVSSALWEDDGPGATPVRLARRAAGVSARAALVVPRALHEVVWGLLAVQVLGFDPLVAVVAIGVPFGAITARVYGDILDDADPGPRRALRAAGASRAAALLYGTVPLVRGDVTSYAFYRLECAVRSAAVLGIIGAGGLGFQLALSFQSLAYREIWTLLYALAALSTLADGWSGIVRRRQQSGHHDGADRDAAVRRRGHDPVLVGSIVAAVVLIGLSVRWTGVSPSTLVSRRARTLGPELLADLWPPRLDGTTLDALWSASIDTLAMSGLAMALAAGPALGAAFLAARSPGPLRLVVKGALLLTRAVPPPVWAFLAVLVLFPGIWPGALALALYNLGVLGRLGAEVVENLDDRPGRALRAQGAGALQSALYSTLPLAAARFTGLVAYRWEVAVRDTVMVGVVGAAGLGRLLSEQLAGRDYQGIAATLAALTVLSALVEAVGAALRRGLRRRSPELRRAGDGTAPPAPRRQPYTPPSTMKPWPVQ
ncbi:MAG: ABC transporter permease subunit [Acidimicrobiia bacterium]|nr:ABC transporter permease subunit [Acidimicrobiia bacterium]